MNHFEFENFLETHERDIYSFCRHLTMDTELAAELYQDTVIAAFEMADRIDVDNNPKAFLLAIAAGKWKNMRRKAARRQGIVPEVPLDAAYNAAGGDNPEKAAIDAQRQESIGAALAGLDEKFRVPLILHYFDDFSTQEISRILKIPAGTVKSRLHKGRALMKVELKKEGISYA